MWYSNSSLDSTWFSAIFSIWFSISLLDVRPMIESNLIRFRTFLSYFRWFDIIIWTSFHVFNSELYFIYSWSPFEESPCGKFANTDEPRRRTDYVQYLQYLHSNSSKLKLEFRSLFQQITVFNTVYCRRSKGAFGRSMGFYTPKKTEAETDFPCILRFHGIFWPNRTPY